MGVVIGLAGADLQPRQGLHRLDVAGVDLKSSAVRVERLTGAAGTLQGERQIHAWIWMTRH